MTKVFAWRKGVGGKPWPVLFHQGIPVDPATNKARDENLLVTVKLPVDSTNDLDKLAEQYPFPLAA